MQFNLLSGLARIQIHSPRKILTLGEPPLVWVKLLSRNVLEVSANGV